MSEAAFLALAQRATGRDNEAAAVLVILGTEWAMHKAEPFITDDGIDFDGMLSHVDSEDECAGCGHVAAVHDFKPWVRPVCQRCAGCDGFVHPDPGPYWSGSERALIELAANLWNGGNGPVNLAYLIDKCDDASLALALDAIAHRIGNRLPGWVRA